MSRWMGRCALLIGWVALLDIALMSDAEIPGLRSRATLASSDLDFELREAAVAASGEVWAAVAARPRGNPTAAESFVLATFDGSREVTQMPLRLPGAEPPSDASRRAVRRRLLEDMEVTADGRLAFALAPGANAASIALMRSGAREVEPPRALALSGADADVQELVTASGGRLLAIGVAGNRPIVAEITPEGKTLWQQEITADPVLIDAARATRDGGVVVLGRRGLALDAQEVWIAKLSARGRLERSVTYAARGGAVAELTGGGFGIVTHAAGARGFDVMVRVLTEDMRERWSKPLVSDQVNPGFDIAPATSGGFVVAGTKDRGLWVTHYDADGRVVWTDHTVPQPPDVEMVSNLKLFSRGDTFVLPYTAFTMEGREQRQSVRVLTFVVK
jgi:hypothetical protein